MSNLFRWSGFLLATILVVILISITKEGFQSLSWDFLNSFPSRMASRAGIKSALFGTLWILLLNIVIAVPTGIATAVYLKEFAPNNMFTRFLHLNIQNLTGVPSIIFGILGLSLFVRELELGRSLISGALTLSLMSIPLIAMSSFEALEAVPNHLRLSARALGANHWQTVRDHVFPKALPGIITGVLLSLSRVTGESAPLLMMGAMTYVAFVPTSLSDQFTVLPVQIYNWASRPQEEFQAIAAGAILVLLAILFTLNLLAIAIKYTFSSRRFEE